MNIPKAEYCSLHLAEVDWHDNSCLITYGPPSDKLLISIKAVGLLQPVLLQRKKGGRFRIVCGSRRLAVCNQLGLETFSCQVLCGSISPGACLRIAIYDNLAKRDLNPVEKALVLAKMTEHMEQAQLISEFMPLLDLERSDKLLDRYMRLLQYEEAMLDSLSRGDLDVRTAFALAPFEQEDRAALFQLFQELPFSVSLQIETIDAVLDIATRDKISTTEIINIKEIRELRENESIAARQRAHDIRRCLQAMRAPRLTARKERFAKEVQELGLPAGVRLVPPPYFEGPRWSLECTFKRANELAALMRQVAALADNPIFQQLMES